MSNPELIRVEAAISQFSFSEQLWLMERLARHIRERSPSIPSADSQQIEEMASDPAIQRELQDIEAEFSSVEYDGLKHQP